MKRLITTVLMAVAMGGLTASAQTTLQRGEQR